MRPSWLLKPFWPHWKTLDLPVSDVDGLVSYTIDPVDETELVRSLGIPQIDFSSRVPYGGGGSQGVILHAAAAITAGVADVVVAYRAVKARSGERFGRAAVRWARDVVTLRFDGDAMVHSVRCPHSGILDGAQRRPLHARVWRNE